MRASADGAERLKAVDRLIEDFAATDKGKARIAGGLPRDVEAFKPLVQKENCHDLQGGAIPRAASSRFSETRSNTCYDRYFGTDPVDRFLVADEVGLGKTLVAKGLIAKLIEHHLTHTRERIDVVYVCSNQAIAKQNFGKLAIVGKERKAPDRITTLPLHVHNLDAKVRGLGVG